MRKVIGLRAGKEWWASGGQSWQRNASGALERRAKLANKFPLKTQTGLGPGKGEKGAGSGEFLGSTFLLETGIACAP